MPINRNTVDLGKFNPSADYPYDLRPQDFQMAMQDTYDFFYDVNTLLANKGLHRLEDFLRPAAMSGVLSDMLTASLGKHSRVLTENLYHNGHPDLLVQGVYSGNAVRSGSEGVEVKSTRNKSGCVDTHGARNQWMCVFVYYVDTISEPATARSPMTFSKVYLAKVIVEDFRRNKRGELGTKTASLHKGGMEKLRNNWIYKI